MTEHLIACLLITHLPVKAELGRFPQLRGRPVVITESYGSKELVLDSSPEARGVAAGMSFQEAVSRCKDAVLLQAEGPYYESRFDAVVWSERKDQLAWHHVHNEGFRRLEGVPATVRVDNEKTAISHGAGAWGQINPAYRRYSETVRFHVDACPPRAPGAPRGNPRGSRRPPRRDRRRA